MYRNVDWWNTKCQSLNSVPFIMLNYWMEKKVYGFSDLLTHRTPRTLGDKLSFLAPWKTFCTGQPQIIVKSTVAEKYNLSHVQHFSATIDISLLRLAFLCYDWHFSATIQKFSATIDISLLRLVFLCYDSKILCYDSKFLCCG